MMVRRGLLILLVAMIGGCAQPGQTPVQTVPMSAGAITVTPWTFDNRPARTVNTPHYQIHTTIEDQEFLNSLAHVMEGAYQQYQRLTPGVQASNKPMECFIFARRFQWAAFTSQNTGDDAHVYLQINRGGYTVRDWYVAYNIGDVGTYAVAAHEGWHQYVARHFKSRLPPFLEEGLATMFENITWPGRVPTWNLAVNYNRADKLKTAIEESLLWPLDQICTMHAGDVVGLKGERIETFYAQNWAFAHFMLYAENGRYRPAFQRMLKELASGEADQFTGRRRGPPDTWDPRTVKPLLEHYLAMSIQQIDTAYQANMRQLAFGSRFSSAN